MAWWIMIRMPGASYQGGLAPPDRQLVALGNELRNDVAGLAVDIGERNVREPPGSTGESRRLHRIQVPGGRLRGKTPGIPCLRDQVPQPGGRDSRHQPAPKRLSSSGLITTRCMARPGQTTTPVASLPCSPWREGSQGPRPTGRFALWHLSTRKSRMPTPSRWVRGFTPGGAGNGARMSWRC